MSPYATEDEYAAAIQRGRRLYDMQKRETWSDAGATIDFRANYNVESGPVKYKGTSVYETVLEAQNVDVKKLVWVDVTSPGTTDATSITRVHAKSGCLVIVLINKTYDYNMEENKIRPSELLWQSFA